MRDDEQPHWLNSAFELRAFPFPMTLEVYTRPKDGKHAHVHARMVMKVKCRSGTGEDITITVEKSIPRDLADDNRDFAIRWLRDAVHWTVCHELDECIYVDNKRHFDPHLNDDFRVAASPRP